MKKAVICDIDGCIIDTSWIWEEVEKLHLPECEKWKFFNDNAFNFEKSKLCIGLVDGVKEVLEEGYELIFLTARTEKIRLKTREMLCDIFGDNFLLFMRAENSTLQPAELKEKHLNEILKNFDVVLAIDDEKENCEMFRRHMIGCIEWKIAEKSGISLIPKVRNGRCFTVITKV